MKDRIERIHYFFRLSLLSCLMVSFAITAFADVKKCYKQNKSLHPNFKTPNQQQNSKEGNTSTTKEICIDTNTLTIKKESEEIEKFALADQIFKSHFISFHLQQYSNPPFAPPRL